MIEITFGNALAQAREIEACADSMTQLAKTSLPGVKNELSAAWQGDSANNYMAKVDMTSANIARTAERLYQIAETLRSVARIFRDSEIRALELAEQRTY